MNSLRTLLNTYSFFSFGAAGSSPSSLVKEAMLQGYSSVALTDNLGVYGAVELYQAAQKHKMKAIIGATIPFSYKNKVYPIVLLASSRKGYKTLNELINLAKHNNEHHPENMFVNLSALEAHTEDLHCLTGGRHGFLAQLLAQKKLTTAKYILKALKNAFHDRLWLQIFFDHLPYDMRRARALRALAREEQLSALFAPEIRYATADLMPLSDSLICGRLGITLNTPHKERPLNDCQSIDFARKNDIAKLYPELIDNANTLAQELNFELLPKRLTPPPAKLPADCKNKDSDKYLESLCRENLLEKYPSKLFSSAKERLETELYVIKSLGFADFFLVAKEVMDFCKSRGIIASGRGSAAGSVVCYLLEITQADPIENNLLFERFLHAGKRTMPDIDIDIASSRRREVFTWIEERFPHSAMVCNRISYYLPSVLQDIGRALGLPAHTRNRLSKSLGRDYRHLRPHRVREAQIVFDEVLGNAAIKEVLISLLAKMEKGFVRQVAPHSGGWVLSKHPLSNYSPQERSTGGLRCLQFDKNDIESLGLMKLDLLGLRMLGVFEKAREEIIRVEKKWIDFNNIPEDEKVWQNIQSGDTMTLFQIESPAQTRMSVQMKPKNKQDLKDQVALVRPGPIQSDSVHPYVRRRRGLEPITYPHMSLKPILEKSYGVLLYQEQVMSIAHHFAGFSWEDADRFRKKVSSFEDEHEIRTERDKFITGAIEKAKNSKDKVDAQIATKIFNMCASFRGFGFAESHAWAFGLHAYSSTWLRYYYPAEYLAAVMSEQPGMYSTGSLRQEARRQNIGFARLDINKSGFHYIVEKTNYGKRLRPPLCAIKAISVSQAKEIILERLKRGLFKNVKDFLERLDIDRDSFEALAKAGAFDKFGDRRKDLYNLATLKSLDAKTNQSFLFEIEAPDFPKLEMMEKLKWDFLLKGYSEHNVHPVDLFRNELLELGAKPMAQLRYTHGFVKTAGLVVARQKPPTAKGFAFWLLEDGIDRLQVVISPDLWHESRIILRDAKILIAEGDLYREGRAWTLKAKSLAPVSTRLDYLKI